MRAFVAILAVAACLAPARAPARAHPDVHVVSVAYYQFVPGDDDLPLELRIRRGDEVVLVGEPMDIHTLTASAVDPETAEPIFGTARAVANGERAEVLGVTTLPPGAYGFYCVPHNPGMLGTLIVEQG